MLDGGYGILPNKILFDDRLSSGAKLLFVMIASLCAEKGYCYAKNQYLAERMGVSTVTIGKQIAELKDYLEIVNPKNHLRQISLKENLVVPQRKLSGSYKENLVHINTSSNNTSLITTTNVVGQEAYGKPEINEIFDYWLQVRGYKISSRIKANRNACNNLLKQYGVAGVRRLIDGAELASQDRFAPNIADIEDLQRSLNKLLSWGKKATKNNMEVIS